jgi:hypothetical protein
MLPTAKTVQKFATYTTSTLKADKVTKSIGYGCATLAYVIEYYAKGKQNRHAQGLHAIASQISYARMITRFTGFFESLEALQNGSWCYPDDDSSVRTLVEWQTYAMLLYYPLEHVSFVGFVYVARPSSSSFMEYHFYRTHHRRPR